MKKKWILLLLIGLTLPGAVTAKEFEKQKVLTGHLAVSLTDHLKVGHSMGNITMVPTNKAEISYEAHITAKSKNEEQAQRILDECTIDFSKRGNTISYTLTQKPQSNSSDSRTVDLTVYFPATLSLEVNHTFGNVTIPDMDGNVTLQTSHGRIVTGQLRGTDNSFKHTFGNIKTGNSPKLKVKISHGNFESGNIRELGIESRFGNVKTGNTDRLSADISNGNFESGNTGELNIKTRFGNIKTGDSHRISADISNGNFGCGNTGELNIKSRFSGLKIGNARRLSADVANGNLTAKQVEDAQVNSRFSSIEFDGIGNSLVVDKAANGSVKVGRISAQARNIDIQSQFAGVSLTFDKTAQLDYSLETSFGSITINGFETYNTNTDNSMNRSKQSGRAGAADPANPTTVRVKTQNANITLGAR